MTDIPIFSICIGRSVGTHDMIRMVESLEDKFGRGYKFGIDTAMSGGIMMMEWTGKQPQNYKSIRFRVPFVHNSNGLWCAMNEVGTSLDEWRVNPDCEIFWGDEENELRITLHLRSHGGAPSWTMDEVHLIEDAMVTSGFVRRGRFPAKKNLVINSDPSWNKPAIRWFHGETGTGKTYRAVQEAGEGCYIPQRFSMEVPYYSGECNIVIDNVYKGDIPIEDLLSIINGRAYAFKDKNRLTRVNARNIWITSLRSPEELYGEDANRLTPLITEQAHHTEIHESCMAPVEMIYRGDRVIILSGPKAGEYTEEEYKKIPLSDMQEKWSDRVARKRAAKNN